MLVAWKGSLTTGPTLDHGKEPFGTCLPAFDVDVACICCFDFV